MSLSALHAKPRHVEVWIKLDGTRWAAVDSYASVCLTFDHLTQ